MEPRSWKFTMFRARHTSFPLRPYIALNTRTLPTARAIMILNNMDLPWSRLCYWDFRININVYFFIWTRRTMCMNFMARRVLQFISCPPCMFLPHPVRYTPKFCVVKTHSLFSSRIVTDRFGVKLTRSKDRKVPLPFSLICIACPFPPY